MTSSLDTAYAHSLLGKPKGEWEPLARHLQAVSELASSYASAFGAREWGRLVGAWHDLGKLSDEFQKYIGAGGDPDAGEYEAAAGRVDHSTFGAQHALRVIGREKHAAWVLAYCIAGHHSGLPDATTDDERYERNTLLWRLEAGPPRVPHVSAPLPVEDLPGLRLPFTLSRDEPGFEVAFFARMLFSCLIDADRTATEAFCDPEASRARGMPKPRVSDLGSTLDGYLRAKLAGADQELAINRARAQVLRHCIDAAAQEPGFFSLNVPTGGGKTYSSLAFALHHAGQFNLRRVIVAIPFTSIVEQTADEYRKALGPLADAGMVEHHSGIMPTRHTRQNQLATENWDVPLVITTNVQLFESLFASATTPCRKLHRIARSVIVLDEAQTIPVQLLRPTLLALRQLVQHYECTVVLCTATQPALQRREGFTIGIEAVRPIVPDPAALFARLRRVEVIPVPGTLADSELAERLASERQVLCIVNSRPHAAQLHEEVSTRGAGEDCFHLSTFMCAAHRRAVLTMVRQYLSENRPCRLISTQLVEAGVDIDFPVVYRAPAGFDSIAQAAGRCNREGRLPIGRLYLFETDSLPPAGMLRETAQVARELFPSFPDPLDPNAVEAYFRQYYWSQSHAWDRADVLNQLADDLRRPDLTLRFREAARRYQVIRDDQKSILVPYDSTARRLRSLLLRGDPVDHRLLRATQPYLVGVWPQNLKALIDQGVLVEHESGVFILTSEDAYTPDRGLSADRAGFDPGLLIQ